MKIRHIVPLCLGFFLTLPASAQFAGSDHFTGTSINTGLWNGPHQTLGGTAGLTQNAGLHFFNTTVNDSGVSLAWNSPAPRNQDWATVVSVHGPSLLEFILNPSHVELGLFVFPTGTSIAANNMPNNMFTASLDTFGTGTIQKWDVFASRFANGAHISPDSEVFFPNASQVPSTPTNPTSLVLLIQYNSVSSMLNASYSVDEGGNWNLIGGYDVTGWDPYVSGYSSFTVGVFGSSEGYVVPVEAGVFADYFEAIAIPEPSTYALLAGLGTLGLACWRRRRKA